MQHAENIINFPVQEEIKEGAVVKADIENGYDRIAHTLTEALANPPIKLSAREYQVVFAIITKTYRWHKRMDWIANTQLSELTGISTSHISEVRKSLLAKNVLLVEGKTVGINPVVSEWGFPKTGTKVPKNGKNKSSQKREHFSPKTGTILPENGNKSSQKREPQKKETIQKKLNKENNYEIPEWLPRDIFNDFVKHRKTIKKPLSDIAFTRLMKQLAGFHEQGVDVVQAIENSIINGWSGVFPPKAIAKPVNQQARTIIQPDYQVPDTLPGME